MRAATLLSNNGNSNATQQGAADAKTACGRRTAKRPPFARQKATFEGTKGNLLRVQRPPFTQRRTTYWNTAYYKAAATIRHNAAGTAAEQGAATTPTKAECNAHITLL